MSNFLCNGCNRKLNLSEGDIFYDGKLYHKTCDPVPDIVCVGIVKNQEMRN